MPSLFQRLFHSTPQKVDPAAFDRLNLVSPLRGEHDSAHDDDNPDKNTIICRETIVNRAERVTGHEFMLKKTIAERIHVGHAMRRLYDQALISQLLSLPLAELLGHRFALIHLDAEHILDEHILRLANQHCLLVLRFGEKAVTSEIYERVLRLRKIGLRFGVLAHECLLPGLTDLAPDVDFVILDVHEELVFSPEVAMCVMAFTHWQLLACHIDCHEAFEAVRHSTLYGDRIEFFQGAFISYRYAWNEPTTPSLRFQLACLLNAIRLEMGTQELIEALKVDPVLFYRLLRLFHSPQLKLAKDVCSAEQMLKLLGRDQLYLWLTWQQMTLNPPVERDLYLLDFSLIRARLMENLAAPNMSRIKREQLFLTGILSLMGLLLKQPLAEVLHTLNLPDSIRAALLTHSGEFYPYLQLAQALEKQEVATIRNVSKKLGFQREHLQHSQTSALLWAETVQKW